MDRSDGKNPFDPETYFIPNRTIQTMLELRAFCADFFDNRVRNRVDTDPADIAAFVTLITHSQELFARARAVIPELQIPEGEPLLPNSNADVQEVHVATQYLRGPPGLQWEYLPEEPAWAQLITVGMNQEAKNVVNNGTGHKKQLSDASARGPSRSTEGVSLMPLLTPSPVKAKGKYKILPKDLDLSKIPTFIPQIKRGAEELVWSPTLGTRPRRSGETYQQSIDALAADPLPFGPGDPSVHSVAYDSANQYHFRDDRDPSDSSWKGHRHSDFIRTTPPQLKSTLSPLNPSLASSSRSKRNHNRTRDRRNNLEDAPFPNDVDRMMEMATLRHNPNSRHSASSHYDTTGYPVQDLSRPTSPSHFRGPRYPSNQVRDIHTSTRFSAPRSAPSYGNVNQTGQGMYGGYPTPYQDQLGPFRPAPSPATSNPFAARTPDPQIWSSNRSSQSISGALPRQMPNQMIQPVHHMTAQAQMPSDMARSSENELSIPPQGLMDPLSYWNMLHQRELEIRTRLRNANRPMTAQEHHYIFLLGEARISAVATQLPDRNGRHARDWLRELGRTLESIWKPGPGAMGFTPLVVARKQDFEKAVEREIEMTKRENWHRQSHSGSSAAYEDFTRR